MGLRQKFGYRPALDGVRGIAIALVVGFHAFGWPRGGTLGVDLFFVLSGFLITTLLLEEHKLTGGIGIRAFYVRRARRLLPALFVLLAPFLLLGLVAAATGSFRAEIFTGVGAAVTYSSNIVVAANPSAVPAGLIHLWSLASEEQFYLLWPVLLLLLVRKGGIRLVARTLGILLAIAVAYRLQLLVRGASLERLYYAPDTHADSLIVGCAAGCCFARGYLPTRLFGSARTRGLLGAASLILVVAATLLIDTLQPRLAYTTLLVPTAFALTAGVLVICAVAGGSALSGVLSFRPLVSLGEISYSLYLWHLPLLVGFAGVQRRFETRTVIAVVVAIGIATASHRLVEVRFLRRRAAATTPDLRPVVEAATATAA